MRVFALFATFLGLLMGLYLLWQHRFERSSDFPSYRLADQRSSSTAAAGIEWNGPGSNPTIRLKFVKPDSPVVALLPFPGVRPVDFIKVRFHLKAHNLALGKDFWDDGRCIIDWHSADGGSVENDPVQSARWTTSGEVKEFVMRPKNGPAIPVLRLENRGRGGELELVKFEATVLRETLLWKIGKWFLLAGWLVWAWALVLSFNVKNSWRAVLAAAIWVTMCLYFVVPGPWKILRPMGSEFSIGAANSKPPQTTIPPLAQTAENRSDAGLESVGKIQAKGDLMLQIKLRLVKLRPLLHLLLLVGPAFLISLLVGWRSSLVLSVLLSCSIEGAQAAFGYGFDWIDTWDLISDGLGIAAGLFLARIFKRWLDGKKIKTSMR